MEISFWDYLPKSAQNNLGLYLGKVINKKLKSYKLSREDLETMLSVSSQELELMMQGKKSWGEYYQIAIMLLGIKGDEVFRKPKPDEIKRLYKKCKGVTEEEVRRIQNISLPLQLLDYLKRQSS